MDLHLIGTVQAGPALSGPFALGEKLGGADLGRPDFEIPAYLPRIQGDINEFLDPNYKSHDKSYRRTVLEFLTTQPSQGGAVTS